MNSDSTEQHFVRIYTDEHVTALLAPALRRRGYESQSCVEADKRKHAGIIITPVFSRRQIGSLLRLTLRLLDRLTADELHNAVVYLQQFE